MGCKTYSPSVNESSANVTHDRFEEWLYFTTDVGGNPANRDESWKAKPLSKFWSLERETWNNTLGSFIRLLELGQKNAYRRMEKMFRERVGIVSCEYWNGGHDSLPDELISMRSEPKNLFCDVQEIFFHELRDAFQASMHST